MKKITNPWLRVTKRGDHYTLYFVLYQIKWIHGKEKLTQRMVCVGRSHTQVERYDRALMVTSQ